MARNENVRIAAASDLHIRPFGKPPLYYPSETFIQAMEEASYTADILILCGDIIDCNNGSKNNRNYAEDAAYEAAQIIRNASIPVLAVSGNHEMNTGHRPLVESILENDGGVTMLEGKVYRLGNLDIIGSIGDNAGCNPQNLEEASELSPGLRTLKNAITTSRAPNVLLATHYSPIPQIAYGDNPRSPKKRRTTALEQIIDADPRIKLVIQGHDHNGYKTGKTKGGVTVNNVAIEVLQKEKRNGSAPSKLYRLFDMHNYTR